MLTKYKQNQKVSVCIKFRKRKYKHMIVIKSAKDYYYIQIYKLFLQVIVEATIYKSFSY